MHVVLTLTLTLALLNGCGHSQVVGERVPSDIEPIQLAVEEGCHDAPSDELRVVGAELTSSRLRVRMHHSGGCEEHSYRLCPDPVVLRTEPGIQHLVVVHDARGDTCETEVVTVGEVVLTELPHQPLELGAIEDRTIVISVE